MVGDAGFEPATALSGEKATDLHKGTELIALMPKKKNRHFWRFVCSWWAMRVSKPRPANVINNLQPQAERQQNVFIFFTQNSKTFLKIITKQLHPCTTHKEKERYSKKNRIKCCYPRVQVGVQAGASWCKLGANLTACFLLSPHVQSEKTISYLWWCKGAFVQVDARIVFFCLFNTEKNTLFRVNQRPCSDTEFINDYNRFNSLCDGSVWAHAGHVGWNESKLPELLSAYSSRKRNYSCLALNKIKCLESLCLAKSAIRLEKDKVPAWVKDTPPRKHSSRRFQLPPHYSLENGWDSKGLPMFISSEGSYDPDVGFQKVGGPGGVEH